MKRRFNPSAESRRWRSAATIGELGELTAQWMEGKIATHPLRRSPEALWPETHALVAVLAAANRAGFLTTDSQPGVDERDTEGHHWQQRAAVTGFATDPELLQQLRDLAAAGNYPIVVHRLHPGPERDGITVTLHNGKPRTSFGAHLRTRRRRRAYPSAYVSRAAFDELHTAWHVTLAAPNYGPSTLWNDLANLFPPDDVPRCTA